jgi:SAM-dependent methyltransferase
VTNETAPSEQQRFFDRRAAGYDDVLFRSRWPRNQQVKAGIVADALGAEALQGRVVELGCGTGQIAEAMLDGRPELRYLGVDLSPAMVAAAAARLARFGDRARVEVAGAPLEPGAGGAFGIDVLHHVPDPVATLRELANAVEAGSRVVFLESNPKFPLTTVYALAHREEHAVLRFTRRRLRSFFERAGLTDVAVRLGPLYTPPGPPVLVPLYDRVDAVAARVPALRALALFYVAAGTVHA